MKGFCLTIIASIVLTSAAVSELTDLPMYFA